MPTVSDLVSMHESMYFERIRIEMAVKIVLCMCVMCCLIRVWYACKRGQEKQPQKQQSARANVRHVPCSAWNFFPSRHTVDCEDNVYHNQSHYQCVLHITRWGK